MENSKNFNEMIKTARERFSGDPSVLNILDEMESDPSLKSRIAGTFMTLSFCDEEIKKEDNPDL